MQRKLSSKSTVKPRLESLETRDLPSGAGLALFTEVQSIQQGVQAMQAQANAAQNTFANKLPTDLQSSQKLGFINQAALADFAQLGGEIQAVRQLNAQVQAELKVFQQSVFLVGSDGDQTDQSFALFAFLQVNGGFGGFFGGSSSGGIANQAQTALNQVNNIAGTTSINLPNGSAFPLTPTIDQLLNS